MKFRVFGGLDCPDSVLAQLSIVSNISPAIIAKLVDHCTNTILFSADATAGAAVVASVGQEKTSRWSDIARETSALQQSLTSSDFGIAIGDGSTSVDALTFAQALTAIHTLVTNITRFNVPAEAATEDLTMLGLDPSVAEVIVQGTHSGYAQLRAALVRQMPMHHAIRGVNCVAVHRTTGAFDPATNSFVEAANEDEGATSLASIVRTRWLVDASRHSDGAAGVTIDMSVEKARALLVELMSAREVLRTQNVTVAA